MSHLISQEVKIDHSGYSLPVSFNTDRNKEASEFEYEKLLSLHGVLWLNITHELYLGISQKHWIGFDNIDNAGGLDIYVLKLSSTILINEPKSFHWWSRNPILKRLEGLIFHSIEYFLFHSTRKDIEETQLRKERELILI